MSARLAAQGLGQRVLKGLLVLLLLLVLLGGAYLAVVLNWSYSTGERSGFMQKFSRKGWVCKTWEGELSLVAMPGAAPEKFYFTVRDSEVAVRVSQMMGRRVTLDYEQHRGLPGTCFGETDYFVVAVKEIAP